MKKMVLNKNQINSLVLENRYPVDEGFRYISRCIDGRYENNRNLPALALPGADIGELAGLFATSRTYGFELNQDAAFEGLLGLINGAANFHFHIGCGYLGQIEHDPQVYNLNTDETTFIKKQLDNLKVQGAKEIILNGEHNESAIIMINGNFGLLPRFVVDKDTTSVYVYHTSLISNRHKKLAQKLMEKKAVELFAGLDDEYLRHALSETMENHFYETLKRLAPGLPLYNVTFSDDGNFKIVEMGNV